MKGVCSQTEVSIRTNSDDDAFFPNAVANPPIPVGATLAQARDLLELLCTAQSHDSGGCEHHTHRRDLGEMEAASAMDIQHFKSAFKGELFEPASAGYDD